MGANREAGEHDHSSADTAAGPATAAAKQERNAEQTEVQHAETQRDAKDATADPTADASQSGFNVTYTPSQRPLQSVESTQQSLLTPGAIEEHPATVELDGSWTQTFWIAGYPDAPTDGLFEQLYSSADARQTDISIHLDPRDTDATLDGIENHIESLDADVEYLTEKRRAGARGLAKDLADYRDLYDVLRNTPTKAFDVSMFLTTSAEERDALDPERVRKTAMRAPSNLTPVTPRWRQVTALTATSPICRDPLDEAIDTTTPMLAGAVGAMFPFHAGAFAEHGIEYGTYALNESPLVIDRFARETGYCMMTIGQLGAGKSFATKLHLLRRAMFDPETIVVMLDPMEGFATLTEVLDGERVTVGGTRGLNPLDIRPTPQSVLDRVRDLDPWAEQISWVVTFFETFFQHVANNPLEDRKQTLRRAIQETYERAGITRDPATHDERSPTTTDLIDVLETMLADPEEFGYETDGEQRSVVLDVESLLKDLRPSFREGGDLANLARPTAFDLDSNVIYLDLHQDEGVRGRSETSLMMQVLFNAVYERAKGTDKRVIFAIDEAHYLLNDSASLGYLETAVRHSRHYDLSLQFITQTGGEFELTAEAKTIADLCSITVIHRVKEDAGQLAEWFGLTEREANWVRTAKAGNEDDGFSEALLGIDEEGWFPVRVRASPFEADAIDSSG
ncbi:Type IV secretory pathway, VirB4 component [Halapricum desulfuricans]|uniref:Type IV secretory pathway, VirB4 component n=1 Tax=Halapricum desulfuricans TaxID=2841257 RepID=A0A897MSM4_9EURY|nr:Type IV secretory pathway, VirB4 component [Halapricum desulfuricans]